MTDKVCGFRGCEKKLMARGLCNTHYERLRLTGSVELLKRPDCIEDGCTNERSLAIKVAKGRCPKHYKEWKKANSSCEVEGCLREVRQRGLCGMHDHRNYRTGSPGEVGPRKVVKHVGTCVVDGCDRGRHTLEFCSKHYTKQRRAAMTAEERREKYIPYSYSRRARKLSVPSEPYTASLIVDRYGTACHICEREIDLDAPRNPQYGGGWELGLHLDHVVPLSRGGTDLIENIRPSHALCNMVKHDKMKEEL